MKGSAFCSYICDGPGQQARWIRAKYWDLANLEVLVGRLLPLARHGVWCGLGEHAHGGEDGQGGTEAGEDVEYDLLVLVGGRLRTRAVRAESNPVSYEAFASASMGWSIFMPHRRLGRDRRGPIGPDRRQSTRLKPDGAPRGAPGSIGGSDDAALGLVVVHSPAFFSWRVRSAQFSFMRSRRAIHSSACSCRGMPSHLFSMLARVGLEMAWVEAAARVTMAEEVVAWRPALVTVARRAADVGRRIIVIACGEEVLCW